MNEFNLGTLTTTYLSNNRFYRQRCNFSCCQIENNVLHYLCSAIPVYLAEAITYPTAKELQGSGTVSMTVLVR